MPPFSSSSSSSSVSEKKLADKSGKGSNRNMSLRTIGRMGQSMSAMMTSNSYKEKDLEDLDQTPLPIINISTEIWQKAQDNLLSDILEVRRALDLFLNSRISEAEKILEPKRYSSLYHSLGYTFVLFLKSMMTFQNEDIEEAISTAKRTIQLADALRKKNSGWLGNITSWVKGVSVKDVWAMSRLHRHAELVYAECYLLKAFLSIVHDESFVSFLREGLHVRSSYNIYMTLQKFLDDVKKQAVEGKDLSSFEVDDHFTSGVSLGVGLFNLMISLLPTSVVKVVEFIGYSSDRKFGLDTLEAAGGWEDYADLPLDQMPPTQEPNEGLRRQFCDMSLLLYHVVLSRLVPLSDVNEKLSDRVLKYSLRIYPNGVFFLFFSGRQLIARRQLDQSQSQYQKAIDTQKDWKQLQHMCYWELGLINLLKQDWKAALDCYTTLQNESNWSKAVYMYLQALSMYMLANSKDTSEKEKAKLLKEAGDMMQKVTGAKQKIAGKSLPLEKFLSRKARKFTAQGNRLILPDLEILSAFTAFGFMSDDMLYTNLDRTTAEIDRLTTEKKHAEVLNYYDDLCLSHFLRSMVLRLLLEQVQVDSTQKLEWERLHKESISAVMDNADKIQLDHYVYYFTRYEDARMLILNKKYDQAKEVVQTIIKSSEKGQFNVGAGPHAKNKYSLENGLLFKCHNCITEINALSEKSSENANIASDKHSTKDANTDEESI